MQRFDLDVAGEVLEAATCLARLGEPLELRVVLNDEKQRQLLHWDRAHGWLTADEL